jgi:hypothetical protein
MCTTVRRSTRVLRKTSSENGCTVKRTGRRYARKFPTRIADDSSLQGVSFEDELDVAVNRLEASVSGVLEEHVARAPPSPYAKRWWTYELKTVRLSSSAARNQ